MSKDRFIEFLKRSDARIDPDLEHYSVPTKALQALSSATNPAFLAIGLKGIGKSAAFRHLQRCGDVDVIQAISAETQEPREVAVSRPTLQYLPEIRSELILQSLITYLETPRIHKVPADLHTQVDLFVKDIWNKTKKAFSHLGGVSILGFGISLRAREKKDSFFRLVPRNDYTKALGLLKDLTRHVHVRIVIDDPEAIFTADERINENLIAALAIASYELSTDAPGFKSIILIKPNVLRALRRVDEFASLPTDSSVRLTWTDEELEKLLHLRAEAAGTTLQKAFGANPSPALKTVIRESRSGPRDALRRLEIQLTTYPGEAVTPKALEKTLDRYAEKCFDQMYAAYERQYPGLCRASIILFEGRQSVIPRLAIRNRLDQMIASSTEILASKDEAWARDAEHFADLLVQFGLVAIQSGDKEILPFHTEYLDEATKADAKFVCIPGLRSRLRSNASIASPAGANRRAR